MARQIDDATRGKIRESLGRGLSVSATAKALGVSRETVRRARVPDRVRKAEEFGKPVPRKPPRRTGPIYCWDLDRIVEARNAQLRGDFALATKMAKAMRTDDAQFIAYRNRLAPQKAITATLVPAPGARGEAVAKKAARSVIAPRDVLVGIVGTLVDHAIAIGYIERETNEDGTRVTMRLTEWPLEFVRWNEHREVLETRTRDGGELVDIEHGNGEWIVFRGIGKEPWAQEACILPGAVVWASHAHAIQDWNSTAKSHGLAKFVATMQDGVPLATEGGTLHPQAESVLNTLQDLAEGEAGAGVFPHGAEPEVLANGSTAWQIFDTLVSGREKSFARIYLGTDAILGSVGGAPGLDIAALFRVSAGVFQGDFRALEEGLRTGLYEPWTAINEGDSKLAPSIKYELPDPDESARSEQEEAKLERVHAEIKRRKESGMIVTQETIVELCKTHAVRNVPTLAPAAQASVPITLAPTDLARVVRVDEARGSQGLPTLGGDVGGLFLTELETKQAADAEAAKIARQAEADAAKATAEAAAAPPPSPVPAPTLNTRAGTYDESKHPRAEDGKFGTGPGSSGGSEGDGPKERKSPRLVKAEKRLAGAKKTHDLVKADHDKAIAYRESITTDVDRATEAKESEAKAARDEVAKHEKRLTDNEKEREDFARGTEQAAKDLAKTEKDYEAAQKDFDKKRSSLEGDELDAAEKDWESKEANYEKQIADLDERASAEFDGGDPDDIKADLKEAKAAIKDIEKQAAAARKGKEAFASGDYRGAQREFRKADIDFDAGDAKEADANVRASAKKLDRAARALKAHEREVARLGKKEDADGDGRTGAAEEKDDE